MTRLQRTNSQASTGTASFFTRNWISPRTQKVTGSCEDSTKLQVRKAIWLMSSWKFLPGENFHQLCHLLSLAKILSLENYKNTNIAELGENFIPSAIWHVIIKLSRTTHCVLVALCTPIEQIVLLNHLHVQSTFQRVWFQSLLVWMPLHSTPWHLWTPSAPSQERDEHMPVTGKGLLGGSKNYMYLLNIILRDSCKLGIFLTIDIVH